MVTGQTKSLLIKLEAAGNCVLGYVYFQEVAPGQVHRTEQVEPGLVMADYDVDGRLLGIEFLDATKADAQFMRSLSRKLHVPELAGLDLCEMCNTAA